MCSLKLKICIYVLCSFIVVGNCQKQLYLDAGELCYKGVCKLLRNCPSAIESIKQWVFPQICSFPGLSIEPIVCCSETYVSQAINNIPDKRISDQKCEEYSKIEVDQAYSIVGGIAALIGEYTHMAAIGYGDERNISWQCGGSLISERYVLTAAHCLSSRDLGNARFVRVGDLNLVNKNDGAKPQDFRVEQLIQHPDYRPPVIYHDIGLIKLNRNVIFDQIRPACLYTSHKIISPYATATGWGATGFGEVTSDDLMKVALEFFSLKQCNQSYYHVSDRRTLPNGILDDYQVCAGGIDKEKDSCQGDSGGPLQIFNVAVQRGVSVVGVTSFGKSCGIANIPGVYTRVSTYVPWIESIVWRT